MSSIDQRVVDMRFNNQQFESGVRTSTKTLDKLKSALNLDGAAKSLNNLDSAAKSFSLSGMASGIETISSRFTAMGIVGMTVLQRLTNAMISAGQNFTKALTVQPVFEGFSEYEMAIKATKVMMSGTGESIEVVNKGLDKLNTYSDDTIYSFKDMTANISKFTNAGLNSDEAANAIIGISNAAALAGASAEDAGRAMYQLGQAISGGYIQLMDWNSVENANMATIGFKNSLLETALALGTLKKSSSGLTYITPKGTEISAIKGFNLSLQDQWLTSEALSKTLRDYGDETTIVGKKAFQAAKDVVSGTQMLNIMRESLAGSWTTSWKILIGNAEEAKVFWTGISESIGGFLTSMSNARNSLLGFWKENGGREALIRGLANALFGLSAIIKPIEQAFTDIFPAITGKRLVEMSVSFRDLMSNFKIGEETAKNLRNTFKGLFAIISIGGQVISAITGGISSFIKYVSPAGKGLLSITGSLGEYLIAIDSVLRSSDSFANGIKKIGEILKPVGDIVKMVASNFLKMMGSIGPSVDNVKASLSTMLSSFTGVLGKMGDTLRNAMTNIVGAFSNGDYTSLLGIINSGIMATIFIGIRNLIQGVSSGFVNKFTDTLDAVQTSLGSLQSAIRSNIIMQIAIAVGILAVSLALLANINPQQMQTALGAITIMFLELFGSMVLFERLMGGAGFVAMGKITLSMIALSTAMLLLSFSVTRLAKLDWPMLTKGLVGIAGLALVLVGSAKFLGTASGGLITSSAGFILLSGALLILSNSLVKIGALDLKTIGKGLLGIGLLMTELALFMKVSNLSGMGLTKSIGVIALATSIVILGRAVKTFSSIDSKSLLKGLGAIAIVLGEIALFMKLTSNATGIITTSIGLGILSLALLGLSNVLINMGSISIEAIGKGLLSMAGALTIIGVAVKLIPNNMITTGLGLMIMAGALMLLSNALINLGSMSIESIGKSLLILAGALMIMTVSLSYMQTSITGIFALFMLTDALGLLSPLIETLGKMSLSQIGVALLGLAGALAVLGVSGYLAAPLAPILLTLSASMFIFGLSLLAISGSAFIFALSMAAIVAAMTAGGISFTLFITSAASLIGLIPSLFTNLAKGFITGIKIIGDGAKTISKAIKDIFLSVIDFVIEVSPALIASISKLVIGILDTLAKYLPAIISSGINLIMALLKGINDNIYKISTVVMNIILGFINAVTEMLPIIIQVGIDFMVSFTNGLAEGIRKNTDIVEKAIINLMDSVVTSGKKVLTDSISGFDKIGQQVVSGYLNGIKKDLINVVDAGKNLGRVLVEATKEKLDIKSPSGEFETIGENTVQGLANGLENGQGSIWGIAKSIGDKLISTFNKTGEKTATSAASAASNAAASTITNTKKSADNTVKVIKDAFQKSTDWIDERKYYNQLSLTEELAAYERMLKRYAVGTDEHKKLDREVYRVKNEMNKANYDNSIQWIENKKFLNELSLTEELAAYERMLTRYAEGTEEHKKLDRDMYTTKQALIRETSDLQDKINQNSLDWIAEEEAYGRSTLESKMAAQQRIMDRNPINSDIWKASKLAIFQIQKEINDNDTRLFGEQSDKEYELKKKKYDDQFKMAVDSIDNEKYYKTLSLDNELNRWKQMRITYKVGSEERKQVDREVFRVEQEIITATNTARKKSYDDQMAMNEEKRYYNKLSLAEELAMEEEIQKTYSEGTAERKTADKEAFKIRNEITTANDEYYKSVQQLSTETTDKRIALEEEYYQKTQEINDKLTTDIQKVTDEYNKAVDSRTKTLVSTYGLFDKVTSQKAVTGISLVANLESQVVEFRTWQSNIKTLVSKGLDEGLIQELESMGPKSLAQIKALNSLTKPELDKYVSLWKMKYNDAKTQAVGELSGMQVASSVEIQALTKTASTELDDYQNTWSTKMSDLTKSSVTELGTLYDEWVTKLGPVRAATESLFENMTNNIKSTISGPNWTNIGSNIMNGIKDGINGNTSSAIESLKSAISGISDILALSIDSAPVIRPVIDLSNIEAGGKQIDSIFGKGIVINTSSINKKIPIMTTTPVTSTQNQNGTISQTAPITFTQNNYSPKTLSKLEIYRQTKNQISAMKGLVTQ